MSPAAKAKSARSPRTGKAKKEPEAKAPEPEPEDNGKAPEESARDIARREKEEKAAAERAAMIEAGDLIVTKDYEFTLVDDKQTASAETMSKVLDAYRESDEPLVFNEVAKKAGAKYPEDLVVAMYVLEELDFVRLFMARGTGEGAGRPKVAFQWLGEEE